MKKKTKILIPMIFISLILILFAGCFGTIPDESPGYTPGTIEGIIAAPCCTTSDGPVTTTLQGVYPEYWCYYCENPWSLQEEIEVVLTYGLDEIATTTTNEKGEYSFTNVPAGKNYVITAYCPDFDDERPLVKDVALEVVEGGSYDTKVTDLVSTSLGLVVDFIVTYSELTPEDIVLDEVIANKPNFYAFPKFKKLVEEVRRVLERNCGNLNLDEDVQEALCDAVEEITDLDFGCGPGFTPPPPSVVINYILTTNANPPEGGSVSGAGTYTSGTNASINATPNVGWQFIGWSGDLGGNTNPTVILMNSNHTVTANFEVNTHTVTFYDCDELYYGEDTVAYGALVTKPTDPSKPGYTFIGWYTDNTFTNEWDFANDTMPDSDLDLYAKCEINTHTVTFYDCDELYYGEDTVAYGALVTKPTDPSKPGYTFIGWYTDNTFTNEWDFANDTMPDSDLDLYAKCDECDMCSPDGWSANVNVYKYWWSQVPGNSGPRIVIAGEIKPPNCIIGNIEIEFRLELLTNGGNSKGTTGEETLTLPANNPFEKNLGFGINIENASYNSIARYRLEIKPSGCSEWIVIDTGEVSDHPLPWPTD